MIKRAIILAGGKGTRLRPYTKVFPKPMMPIGKFIILEIVIKQLKFYGFKHITISVGHQANLIKAFFGNGSKFKISIKPEESLNFINFVQILKYLKKKKNI